MENWKSYFEGKILSRGLDYYEYGDVRIHDSSPQHVEAQVKGSRTYNVRINFKDSHITSMYCDCPYFEGYDNCKHLAAVLYHIDEHPELLSKSDFEEILSSCTHDELVEFLSRELPKNPDLLNKLKLFKGNNLDETYYISKLHNSFKDSFDILKFMDTEFNDLIELKQYDLLFKLCKVLIDHINEQLSYGDFPLLVEIIQKFDDITTRLRNVNEAHEGICDFLEYAITTSDDYYILDELTDSMSRNGDMSRLLGDEIKY